MLQAFTRTGAPGLILSTFLLFTGLSTLTAQPDSYSKVGKEGDLRLSNGLAGAEMKVGSQLNWYGEFDYYLNDSVSLYGSSQIPLQPVDDGLRPYFTGMGFHYHFYNWGALDFFAGFGGGLTYYVHPGLPFKAITTMDISAGTVLFGHVWHVFAKVSYRRSEYYGGGVFYNLNHPVYIAGIGFHF